MKERNVLGGRASGRAGVIWFRAAIIWACLIRIRQFYGVYMVWYNGLATPTA